MPGKQDVILPRDFHPAGETGHVMFRDWDSTQWHMFDNLMFYCVREYVRSYSRGEDIFNLY